MTTYCCAIKSGTACWAATGYFLLMLGLSAAGFAIDLENTGLSMLIKLVSFGAELLVLTGIAGYIWNLAIGAQWFWKWVSVSFLLMLTCLAALFIASLGFISSAQLYTLLSAMVFLLLLLPGQVYLFRYAFQSAWLWNRR